MAAGFGWSASRSSDSNNLWYRVEVAKPKHLALLKEGVWKWNHWREHNPISTPDFREADLHSANLSKANLVGANFTESDLSGADFTGANLTAANFGGANLSKANLHEANLSKANLRKADLREARLWLTAFPDADLTDAKGLEFCIHYAPSSIGIDTFFKSGGTIPANFLRGCGVPEPFIVQMKALISAMEPVQFYSCFISYSSYDQTFAERLNADLRAKNLRCWFAPDDLKTGDRFQEHIEDSIRAFDKVMIVLSEASLQSRWVEREVNAAREREDREDRTVLFPIRIDDAVMNTTQPWAADIRRSRHIGDFRAWKAHDSYVKALDRLLRDLTAGNAPAPG